jgi:DMSO/TMAO reductase YedYZ molybdopterin-dependent catalytic subunit
VSSAALDRLLALLVLGIGATGLVSLRAGAESGAWIFVAHDLVALVLAGAVAVKLVRSVPGAIRRRSFGRLALGLAVAAVALVGLVGGVLWVGSGRLLSVGSLTVMTLHAWAGLVLAPLVFVHLVPRRWRVVGPSSVRRAAERGMSRRAVLALGALGVIGVAAFGLTAAADRLLGGSRRFTGSRWLPSGTVPPSTTFIADTTPSLDAASWRLRVDGLVAAPTELDLAALSGLDQHDAVAVLDCTSGWAVEAAWHGVSVADVLALARPTASARRLVVRSATGWASSFELTEAGRLLLATGVAGGRLPAANGAPCRLVAPDHRGLDWVKWVTELEVA